MISLISPIQESSHPAVPYVLAWLDAQARKDYEAFAECLGPEGDVPLFINLPGGVLMRNAEQILARHKAFYESSAFQVQYGELQDGMGNKDFFVCSVLVHVTLPTGKKRTNYIDMTFLKNETSGPAWIPRRLINTVVDATR